MTHFINSGIIEQRIEELDYSNTFFKISKPLSNQLISSVQKFGVIEPIIVFKTDSLIPISGHNRIVAAFQVGIKNIPAYIVNNIGIEDFLKIVRIKHYHDAIGPIGKLKILKIAKEFFNADTHFLYSMSQELSLPSLLLNEKLLSSVFQLPQQVLNYLDGKSLSPKFIIPLLRLPNEAIEIINSIITRCNVRVNYFTQCLAMIEDLWKSDVLHLVEAEVKLLLQKERVTDEDIVKCIQHIRYPEYTRRMQQIQDTIRSISGKGITVQVPPYLEGNHIDIVLRIQKGEPLPALLMNDAEVTAALDAIMQLL